MARRTNGLLLKRLTAEFGLALGKVLRLVLIGIPGRNFSAG